jgi:hypothetical protein
VVGLFDEFLKDLGLLLGQSLNAPAVVIGFIMPPDILKQLWLKAAK